MAKDNVIGLAMGLDVTDLKAGINEVKKLVKQSKNEFNSATAGLDKWTKSSEGLNAKLTQLDKQLDAQKKSVAGYKAEIERVSKLEGDHTEQLDKLKDKLNQAEIAVKKTESQISKYSNSLSEINAENKKAESSFGLLTQEIENQKAQLSELEFEYKDTVLTYGKNSKEAKKLAKEISNLSGDLQQNESKVKKSDKALENLENQLDDTEGEAKDLGSALEGIKSLGGTVAKGVGIIGASIGGIATAFFATAESTREFRTNMGKVETAFETAGLSAKDATKTYQDLYSVVADEGKATEATAHIGKLAKSQQDLQKWTNICTGVYATFGDSLPIENLAEASNETAKTGKITGGLADALNWAGVSEDKFQKALDKCSNEQERNKLITETLNGLYSEASDKYRQTNKDVIESNKSQAKLTETMAQLGEKAEPILTTVKDGFNQVLQAVIDLINGADLEGIKDGIENAFQYFIDTIIPAIVDGFQWILDNKDTLIAGIVGIGTAMATWNVVNMIQGIVKAIKGWTVATEGLTVAQRLQNLAMKANPIGIVISLVVALVTAFITLWNTSDEFRAFWINLWNKIKETTSKAVKAIGEFFSNLWKDIKKIWGKVVPWFKDIGSKISDGFKKALNATKEFFSNTWNNIKKTWSKVISWFKNIGTSIANGFKTATNNVKKFFVNTWNNIKNVWGVVSSWFKNVGTKIVNAFKSIPSKIKTYFSNAKKNITSLWSTVSGWFGKTVTNIINKFKSIPDRIRNFFSTAWSNVKKAWSNPKQFFTDIKDKIVNTFKELPSKVVSVGTDLVKGLWNGIKDKTAWIGNKIKGFCNNALDSIKDFFGIRSPSIEMAKIGDYLVQGFAEGIIDNEGKAISASEAMAQGIEDVFAVLSDEGEVIGLATTQAMAESIAKGSKDVFDSAQDVIDYFDNFDSETEVTIEPKVESKPAWKKFIDDCENALGISEEKLKTWKDNAGNYIEKIGKHLETIASKITDFADVISNAINQALEQQMEQLEYEFELFNQQKDKELEMLEANFNAEIEHQAKLAENGEITQEELTNKKILLEAQLATKQQEIENQKQLKEQETLRKKNQLAEKQFNAEKANNIANALINGAVAIVKGFADLGPIAGAVNAGIQATLTGVQVGTISSQQYVPMLAKGGIVDGPTLAVIGEAGKEAVMPLENNTGWITELAQKLSSIMQKDLVGNMGYMQYAVPAYAGNTTINNNYQQVINSPRIPSRKEIYRDTKNLLALKGV